MRPQRGHTLSRSLSLSIYLSISLSISLSLSLSLGRHTVSAPQGLGLRSYGLGFWVSSAFRVYGFLRFSSLVSQDLVFQRYRVEGLGCSHAGSIQVNARQGMGFRVQGQGFSEDSCFGVGG